MVVNPLWVSFHENKEVVAAQGQMCKEERKKLLDKLQQEDYSVFEPDPSTGVRSKIYQK